MITSDQYSALCDVIDHAKMDDKSEDTDAYAMSALAALGLAPPQSVPAKLTKKGKVKCGNCGSKTFRYDEDHPSSRRMESNEDGVLAFWGHFEWFDGDDDPGVVCDACDTPAILPEGVELGWR